MVLVVEVSYIVAFGAGIVSFLAPCVLPLVPGFLIYLAGTSAKEGSGKRWDIVLASILFVAGFSLVFSLLGVLLNTVLMSVSNGAQLWLSRAGGLIIIFFGLYLIGLIRISWLEQEHKFSVTGGPRLLYCQPKFSLTNCTFQGPGILPTSVPKIPEMRVLCTNIMQKTCISLPVLAMQRMCM